MRIKQVRNTTLIIEYVGKTFLVDPFLAEKGAYTGFDGTANSHLRNPLVDLTVPMDEILDVDPVIVTHLHPDHWDEAPKTLVRRPLRIAVVPAVRRIGCAMGPISRRRPIS
jgi:L-ascorbate metabolism protein UlaG (beta-lactamase superfamily)